MAATPELPQHVNDRQEDLPIMEDPIAVQQDEQDMVQVEMEVSEDSWSSEEPATSSWKTTLIFTLDRDVTSPRLDWNDYETLHASVAREVGVSPTDLYHILSSS